MGGWVSQLRLVRAPNDPQGLLSTSLLCIHGQFVDTLHIPFTPEQCLETVDTL